MPSLDEPEYRRWREEAERALRGARLQADEVPEHARLREAGLHYGEADFTEALEETREVLRFTDRTHESLLS